MQRKKGFILILCKADSCLTVILISIFLEPFKPLVSVADCKQSLNHPIITPVGSV